MKVMMMTLDRLHMETLNRSRTASHARVFLILCIYILARAFTVSLQLGLCLLV